MQRLEMRSCLLVIAILVGPVFLLQAWALRAPDGDSFFKGKTIRLVVGYSPGGGFDTFARLVARYLGSRIPGQPKVIVVNMPGAGSLSAANRVYAIQPGDGLTIVTFHYSLIPQGLAGDSSVKFDPFKYIWLGDPSVGGVPRVLFVRGDLPIHNLADLKKWDRPLALGETGINTASAAAGKFLSRIGYPVKNVPGYRGSAGVMAALERKEVDARITNQTSMEGVYRRFLESGMVRPILSLGSNRHVEPFPGIATIKDLNLSPSQGELAEFLITTWRYLRVFAVPPRTPQARVAALQNAFLETAKSPELQADAKRQGVIVYPTSGEAIAESVQRLSRTTPQVLGTYAQFLGLKN